MEILLNLVWALIVIAAAVRFAIWSRGRSAHARIVVGLATICVLALLFPIISITDDLHSTPAVFEETRIAPSGLTIVLAIIATIVVFSARLRLIRLLIEEPVHRRLDGIRTAICVRPPPLFVH